MGRKWAHLAGGGGGVIRERGPVASDRGQQGPPGLGGRCPGWSVVIARVLAREMVLGGDSGECFLPVACLFPSIYAIFDGTLCVAWANP